MKTNQKLKEKERKSVIFCFVCTFFCFVLLLFFFWGGEGGGGGGRRGEERGSQIKICRAAFAQNLPSPRQQYFIPHRWNIVLLSIHPYLWVLQTSQHLARSTDHFLHSNPSPYPLTLHPNPSPYPFVSSTKKKVWPAIGRHTGNKGHRVPYSKN